MNRIKNWKFINKKWQLDINTSKISNFLSITKNEKKLPL